MAAGAVTMDTLRRACRFHRRGNEWFFKMNLPGDITIQVGTTVFHLHKFPLLSRCGKIARTLGTSDAQRNTAHIELPGCPGGADAFLLAAMFCYGLRVELTAKNVLAVFCVAEHLEMTELYGEENLLSKAASFLHKNVLQDWKLCILALQSSSHLAAERVNTPPIVDKALCAVCMMACTDLSLFGWPMMMYGHKQSPGGSILWNGINTGATIRSDLSDWWFEDASCLSLPLFCRLMEIMKERGMTPENISGAVIYYARKHLPGLDRWLAGHGRRGSAEKSVFWAGPVDQRALIESMEKLLPEKKGKSVCQLLLGLLRIATMLGVRQSCRHSLERRIGAQLELATLEGLMIPSFSADSDSLYDTDCVERIIKHYLSAGASDGAPFSPSAFDAGLTPSSTGPARVPKLVDSYLAEIASDETLEPPKMRALLEAFPGSLRPLHDGLYRALDIYFKAHPWLPTSEREQLLGVLDLGRLSMDACSHASQNQRLPLRVTLQVLFFEQLQMRTAISSHLHLADAESNATGNGEDAPPHAVQAGGWVSLVRESRTMRVDMDKMRSRVKELEREFVNMKQEVKRVGRPHGVTSSSRAPTVLGCMHLPHWGDPPDDASRATPATAKSHRGEIPR